MESQAILLILVLIPSIIAHEVAHGYAANWLGDPTARLAGRLTLNPLPHIDIVGSIIVPALLALSNSGMLFGWAKPVPYNPYNLRNQRWGEAIVAVAGSATNLFLAVFFALLIRFAGDVMSPSMILVATNIIFANLFLGLFNLIPFPPLDGFTVLRGVLPFSLSHRLRGLENQVNALGIGGIFLILIVFSFVLISPFFTLVSFVFKFLVGA